MHLIIHILFQIIRMTASLVTRGLGVGKTHLAGPDFSTSPNGYIKPLMLENPFAHWQVFCPFSSRPGFPERRKRTSETGDLPDSRLYTGIPLERFSDSEPGKSHFSQSVPVVFAYRVRRVTR